jgi:subtilisin family serine protease/N-acetylneuraminic acid mutarotase
VIALDHAAHAQRAGTDEIGRRHLEGRMDRSHRYPAMWAPARLRTWWAAACVPVLALMMASAAPAAGWPDHSGTSGGSTPPVEGPVSAEGMDSVEAELLAQFEQQDVATFWVLLEEQVALNDIGAAGTWQQRGSTVHAELTATADRSQSDLRRLLTAEGVEWEAFWIVNAVRVTGDRRLAVELAERPEVAQVLADRGYQVPDLPFTVQQEAIAAIEWNIERVRAPQVWSDFDTRGEGVVVATIDTGVDFDHPALAAQYRGANDDGTFSHDYNWFDPSRICGDPSLEPCDNNGHGTHVTGTMVGDDGDAGDNQIGVAPAARWIAAKGCETTTCSLSALLSSGQWVLAPTDLAGGNPDPSRRPHIVNNSWGTNAGADPFYRATVQAWVAAGIFPTFSNGNAGPGCGTVGSPASYPEAYGVGAFNISNAIASTSSRGPAPEGVGGSVKPDISAPGVNVRSSLPGGGYGLASGTSMAAPHVSAAVALMWSAAPGLIGNIDQTRQLLDDTAIDVENLTCGGTPENNNVWGQGRLDAYAAVDLSPRGPVGTLQGTVTDTAGQPVAAATVAVSGPAERTTVTGPDGGYTMDLPVGGYDVTVTAYGHQPAQRDGVVVAEDATTVEDFSLVPLPPVTVTGTVTDASGHGWPLYARIDIDGYPHGPVFSDPVTGQFNVELVQQTAFEFTVHAVGGGYVPAVRQATYQDAAAGEDFGLQVDPQACDAPGYAGGGSDCAPVPGGMLVGNVYALATGEAIDGATVTSDDAPADTATTGPTPDDPHVDDGFYLLFSSLTGPRPFTVSRDGFGSTTEQVEIVAGAVVRHDVQLGSGLLVVEPADVDVGVPLGDTAERTLTLRNEGTADATAEIGERDRGSDILGAGADTSGEAPSGAPLRRIDGTYSPLSVAHAPASASGGAAPAGSAADPAPQAPPWTDIAGYPVSVMDNLADVWEGRVYSVGGISGPGGGRIHEMYRYDPADDSWTELTATTTGRERPNGAIIDGRFYVVGGWNQIGTPVTTLEIYDIATGTWSIGAPVPTAYAASSNVVLDGRLYLIGGCQAGCGFTDVWVYDPAVDEWSAAAPYPQPISWTHCGAIDGRIYCAGGARTFPNDSTANGYVYDPAADAWSPIAPLPQDQWGGAYLAAGGLLLVSGGVTADFTTITNEGFAYDPATGTWSPLPNANHVRYRGASACGFYRIGGAVSGFNAAAASEVLPDFDGCGVVDLPWLDVSPTSVTVPAGGEVELTVTLDADAAGVDQPGAYRAVLAVRSDTPHPVPAIPVTMTAEPPPSWGKLRGTVVGLDRCDAPGQPLAAASVRVAGRHTDVTLATGPDGGFAWWLPARENPLTVTAVLHGWVAEARERVVVPSRQVVTEDFTLRLDAPCASLTPDRVEVTVAPGGTVTVPVVLGNQPAAASLPFSIDETPFALDPLPPLVSGPAAAGSSAPATRGEGDDAAGGTDQDGGWLRAADLPSGFTRYAHAQCDGDPDSSYVFGGSPATAAQLDEAWHYSASADEWTRLASLPSGTATEGPTAVCEAGRIHLLGGSVTTRHLVYDIGRDRWRTAAPLPRPVWGAASGAFNGRIYLIGGDSGFVGGEGAGTGAGIQATSEVNVYDIATDTWIGTGSPVPAPVVTPGYTQAGRYVYVVGSWGPQTPGPNTFTQRYDMVSDTWQSGPTYEPGRADFALAATNDALYAIGGGSGFTTPNVAVERLWLADWPGGAWEPVEPLPVPVWGNSGGYCTTTGAFGGEVWTVSGRTPGLGTHGRSYYRDSGGAGCPTIRADVPWLRVEASSGTVPADGSTTLQISVEAVDLIPGAHRASLLVTTGDPAHPEMRLPVQVTVDGEPDAVRLVR